MCVLSCVQLLSTLWNPLGSSVHGILQARIQEWTAISYSRGSSRPKDQTHISCISCIGRQVLYHWHHLGSCYKNDQFSSISASTSVLPMNTQDWSPLGWTSWISLQSKGLSRVFSNTTVQKHQFFGAQLSSLSNSHIHTWPLEKP